MAIVSAVAADGIGVAQRRGAAASLGGATGTRPVLLVLVELAPALRAAAHGTKDGGQRRRRPPPADGGEAKDEIIVAVAAVVLLGVLREGRQLSVGREGSWGEASTTAADDVAPRLLFLASVPLDGIVRNAEDAAQFVDGEYRGRRSRGGGGS